MKIIQFPKNNDKEILDIMRNLLEKKGSDIIIYIAKDKDDHCEMAISTAAGVKRDHITFGNILNMLTLGISQVYKDLDEKKFNQ